MQTLCFICFGVGVGYTLIGFVLGEVIGLFDFDFHLGDVGDVGDLGDIGDIGHGAGALVSPLKPSVIAAFLTVFGGVGLILLKRMPGFMALAYAGAAGLFVAFVFYRFVIVPLYRAQNTSAVEKRALLGHAATVSEGIPQGGFGKIAYVVENGNTLTAPAKSDDGCAIARNESVEIVHIEKSTYYVRKRDEVCHLAKN